jgi:hypothetical protein
MKRTWNMTNSGHAFIVIFDNQGRQVAESVDGYFDEGLCHITISTSNFQPGIYFCHLATAEAALMKKIVVVQ